MHQALPNKALDSTAERGIRVEVTEVEVQVEVQVEELPLVRDQ